MPEESGGAAHGAGRKKKIHVPVEPTALFEADSFRTIVLSEKLGISSVVGRLAGDGGLTVPIQASAFDSEKWDDEQAVQWVKEHAEIGDEEREDAGAASESPSGPSDALDSAEEEDVGDTEVDEAPQPADHDHAESKPVEELAPAASGSTKSASPDSLFELLLPIYYKVAARLPDDSVEVAFVDQVYTGEKTAAAAKAHGIRLQVVKLPKAKHGFVLLPRRWIVERSFGRLTRFRRLARDYERLAETLVGLHFVAFAVLLAKRFVTFMVQNA